MLLKQILCKCIHGEKLSINVSMLMYNNSCFFADFKMTFFKGRSRIRYGEIVNINLVRDKATGKSRGFAFICYEDQRSTILAVDNLNGIKILGRTIRVDHCEQYRAPNADMSKIDELTAAVRTEGCAPVAPKEEVLKVKQEKEHKENKRKHKDKKSKKKKKKKSKKTESASSSGD